MKVIKRNGNNEEVQFDKITRRINIDFTFRKIQNIRCNKNNLTTFRKVIM